MIRTRPGDSLTPNMRETLIRMVKGSGISYEYDTDRTMLALRRRGLVGYSRGAKYGKAHWSLTDEGTDRAKHLRSLQMRGVHALFLTPSQYDLARRQGLNMLDYVIQRPIPIAPRKHLDERACPDDICMPGHGGKCTACGNDN